MTLSVDERRIAAIVEKVVAELRPEPLPPGTQPKEPGEPRLGRAVCSLT